MKRTKEKRIKRQSRIIVKNGLCPMFWIALTERETYMIVKHRFTGEVRVINK